MRIYRRIWAFSWGSVTCLAAAVGAALSGPAVPVVLAVLAGFSAWLSRLCRSGDPGENRPAPGEGRMWAAATFGTRVGVAVLLLVSATCLLGLAVVPLVLGAVVTSPRANRWLYPAEVWARPEWLGGSRRRRQQPLQVAVTATTLRAAVETLNDADLTRGWRGSYVELSLCVNTAQSLELVNLREAYLDEMERRDPVGLQAWLDTDPPAIGDPASYLTPRFSSDRPSDESTGPQAGPDEAPNGDAAA